MKTVREAAVAAAVAIVGGMHLFDIEAAKPAFRLALASKQSRRETANFPHRRLVPEQVPEIRRQLLVTLAMPVAEQTCDIKKEVKEAAVICMPVNCGCTGNKDLEPFPPLQRKSAQTLDSSHAGVEKFTGCIFGQKAETSALPPHVHCLPRF